MQKQTKIDSVLEAITNILIGAGIALLAQLFWFPLIGKNFTLTENLVTTAFFTLISFVRSYGIRRAFNGHSVYKTIKDKLKKQPESQTGTLTFSMDDFRKNLTRDVEEFGTCINEFLISNELVESDRIEIISLFDELACSINFFNCTFIKELPDFNSLSDLEVTLLGSYE